MSNDMTAEARRRHVKVAAHAILEELRIGGITGKEALEKLRQAHADVDWPFDAKKVAATCKVLEP